MQSCKNLFNMLNFKCIHAHVANGWFDESLEGKRTITSYRNYGGNINYVSILQNSKSKAQEIKLYVKL